MSSKLLASAANPSCSEPLDLNFDNLERFYDQANKRKTKKYKKSLNRMSNSRPKERSKKKITTEQSS